MPVDAGERAPEVTIGAIGAATKGGSSGQR
jgi:hypothetical protein